MNDYDDLQDVHREATVAAEWWANFLRDPDEVEHDAGDLMVNAVTSWARDQDSRNDEFEAGTVDAFEDELIDLIQDEIDERESRGSWDYDEPYRGQTFMKCDYHADPLLQEAAETVGLDISSMTTFPIKTSMWIDPGEVRVKNGYTAGIETIWERGDHVDEIREYVIDWTRTVEHPDSGVEFEHDPKVFPVEHGYLVRVYGAYDPDKYGPDSEEFYVVNDALSELGVERTLNMIENDVEQWWVETQ
jgi:hypothetical protein